MEKDSLWSPEFLCMSGSNLIFFMSQYVLVASLRLDLYIHLIRFWPCAWFMGFFSLWELLHQPRWRFLFFHEIVKGRALVIFR